MSDPGHIEQELRNVYNVRTPYPRNLPPQEFPLYSHDLIRNWLRTLGDTESHIAALSDRGLEGAYSAGRVWVRKTFLGETPIGFTPGTRYNPNKRRGGKILDEKGSGFKPGEILDTLSGGKTLGDMLQDIQRRREETQSSTISLSQSDFESAVAKMRAENAEINRRQVEAARQELTKSVVSAVNSEVERMGMSDKLRQEVRDLATSAAIASAEELLSKRLPRKLEIKTSQVNKILDAEPRHEAFERILFWLALKRHVYIVGPHGTGKTHMGRQLASALDMTYFPIGQTLTKYELSGYKGPSGEYIGTLLRDAIENGGLVFIDEGDTWAAAAMVFLNTPLANGYCSFPDKVVEVHKNFVCVIAANTWGHGATMQYQGRNPLDAASLDRFAFETVDYDPNLEIQLYGNTPWTQYCQRVRKVARDFRLFELAPSMRAIDMGNQALNAGGDPEMVQKSLLWKNAAEDTVQKIKNSAGTFGRQIREVA